MSAMEMEARLIDHVIGRRKKILEEAEEEAERIREQARREAERIREQAEKEVLRIIASELRAVRDRIVGEAELRGRRLLMEAREKAISSVFEEVRRRLEEIARGEAGLDYGEILLSLIEEAASQIGGERFIVSANERDIRYLRQNLEEVEGKLSERIGGVKITIADIPISCIGGVVVSDSERTKIYHNTLDGRLERVERRMRAEVAERLGVV
jgi:V/A-type H+-transporting ATPase subunit E